MVLLIALVIGVGGALLVVTGVLDILIGIVYMIMSMGDD